MYVKISQVTIVTTQAKSATWICINVYSEKDHWKWKKHELKDVISGGEEDPGFQAQNIKPVPIANWQPLPSILGPANLPLQDMPSLGWQRRMRPLPDEMGAATSVTAPWFQLHHDFTTSRNRLIRLAGFWSSFPRINSMFCRNFTLAQPVIPGHSGGAPDGGQRTSWGSWHTAGRAWISCVKCRTPQSWQLATPTLKTLPSLTYHTWGREASGKLKSQGIYDGWSWIRQNVKNEPLGSWIGQLAIFLNVITKYDGKKGEKEERKLRTMYSHTQSMKKRKEGRTWP